jgi:hypothetical protein
MITKEYIEKEYIEKRRPVQEIVKEIGCGLTTFNRYRKKYGIPIRADGEDLTGKTFNGWEVIEKIERKNKNGDNTVTWLCRCKCGSIKEKQTASLNSPVESRRTKECAKCRGFNHRSKEVISQSAWSNIIHSAQSRNLELSITKEYVTKLFIKQEQKCALTGLPIFFPEVTYRKCEGTASLDRINPKLGYVHNNVQWVHKKVNAMKQDLDENIFLKFCKIVSKNYECQ